MCACPILLKYQYNQCVTIRMSLSGNSIYTVMICCMLSCLGGCTLLSIPVAVVDIAAGIVKLPITAVDAVMDAVNGDEDEE